MTHVASSECELASLLLRDVCCSAQSIEQQLRKRDETATTSFVVTDGERHRTRATERRLLAVSDEQRAVLLKHMRVITDSIPFLSSVKWRCRATVK